MMMRTNPSEGQWQCPGAEAFLIQVEEAGNEDKSDEEEGEYGQGRLERVKAFKFLEKIQVGRGFVA